jgi:hypothetical protein
VHATFRSVVEIFAWGCALLATIQLPGALLDGVIRRDIGLPLILVGVLSAAAALLLRLVSRRTWPRGWRLAGAFAVAFAIAATLAQASLIRLTREVVEVADIGILVPAPGRSTECRGQPRRCHDIELNELGFRGRLPRRATAAAPLVAFIGDSHVFGSGVGDQDTVPAVVALNLSDRQPPVAVVNAGIPGINGGSFPGVIRYVRTRLDPDVIVVLLKDDDLDETDKFTRWELFRRSFWFRMFSVTNFEPIYETVRQIARLWFEHGDESAALRHLLDGIAAATAGAKLVVVAAFGDDLQPTFAEWMAAHPEVVLASSWDHPEFWEAERIPYDGHWTEAGSETIAGIVTPVLRDQLEGGAPSPPGEVAR